jgi:hypothetical protein
MLTFKTNVLGGPPFYMGTVTYNKAPAGLRKSDYYGHLSSSSRPIDPDNGRRSVCVHYSQAEGNTKQLDLRQVAMAMRTIMKTINSCENDRIRSSRRRPFLGNTDEPFAV